MILGVVSCTNERVERDDRVQVVEKQIDNSFTDFPFSDKEELKLMSGDDIIDFEIVRKISMLELSATGIAAELNWQGARLSDIPITIYDLNSRPRYYDFIVYSTDHKSIGTVRTYAKMERNTVIEGVYRKVTNYRALLTKTFDSAAVIFMDWKGTRYVGKKAQFDKTPTDVIDMQGNPISGSELRDLEGVEIVDYMILNIFPKLILTDAQQEEVFAAIPQEFLENTELQERIYALRHITLATLKDSMIFAWEKTKADAADFWNLLAEHKEELLSADDFNIAAEPEWLGRFIRRWFYPIDTKCYPIYQYDFPKDVYRTKNGKRSKDWCGPWACGYILYVNQSRDEYDYFLSHASTHGELAIGNIVLRLFGHPMTPFEISRAMPLASKGKIWIEPSFRFLDLYAYDQIKYFKRPALRLCGTEDGQLHWTLAYGARQTGNWRSRTYYFLQIDNGGLVGVLGSPDDESNYTQVDWWNPWLLVWD